jgi:hypothetical protein
MPSMPHAVRSRNAPLVLIAAASAFVAAILASCATDRLITATPQGVDLSGEWRLNENLSDDPSRVFDETKDLPMKAPAPGRNPGGFGRPGTGRPGAGGGIDPGAGGPGGGGENLTRADSTSGFMPVLYVQDAPLPGSTSDSGPASPAGKGAARGPVAQMLAAPALLTISQSGSKVIVKSTTDGTSDEYTAGEQRTISYGQTEADRSAGWRDNYFVVITKAHKGPSKEDDFALDGEGHLIFATLVTHVKKGPIDFKRVYDRVRTPR